MSIRVLPRSRAGTCSIILVIAAAAIFVAWLISLASGPPEAPSPNWNPVGLAAIIVSAAGSAAGLVAMLIKKDRSVAVVLGTAAGLVVLVFSLFLQP